MTLDNQIMNLFQYELRNSDKNEGYYPDFMYAFSAFARVLVKLGVVKEKDILEYIAREIANAV